MTKVVVVSGANRGLGLEIVRVLLAADYAVIAISRKPAVELEKLSGKKLLIVNFDFEHVDEIHQLSKTLWSGAKRVFDCPVYGLVNNAAVATDGVLGTMHASDIERLLKVNVQAPILLTKYMSRHMLLHQVKGRIVNMGSIVSSTGYAGLSVYGATKSAMEGFSRSLAREVGRRGITVNVVAPGFMKTDMTSTLDEQQLSKIRKRSALREFASTTSVANMVEYLLSDKAEHISGSVLTVDGGSTA